MNDIFPWQKTAWQSLTTRYPNMGHALLLYGRTGCGKHTFAKQLAMWVLCTQKQPQMACGKCASCQWFKSDTHPNFVHITLNEEEQKKSNAKIKIEKIRDLLPFVQQTGEGWRVVLIEPAQALNIASSNALLKTLEEPGERILLILVANHFLQLPATIRSRVQRFALDRIDSEQTTQYLAQYLPEQQSEQIDLLLNLANGMPLAAIDLLQSEWLPQRQAFLSDWLQLVSQKQMPMQLSSKWHKAMPIQSLLALIEYLLCDLICVKLNQKVINIDLNFTALVAQYSLETCFELLDHLQASKRLLAQNVQSQLVVDQFFIELMHV